jgi:hypothetical protein
VALDDENARGGSLDLAELLPKCVQGRERQLASELEFGAIRSRD